MKIRFPDFICIGAQKSGTTWLYENLKNQAGVALPVVKELQYFNEIWLPYQREWAQAHRRKQVLDHFEWYLKSVARPDWDASHLDNVLRISQAPICDEWYGRVFGDLPEEAVVGEMTPEYALLPLIGFQHILRLNERIKFVFIVRDPIERAWSQIKMIVRNEGRRASIENYMEILTYGDIKERSDYFSTIRTLRQAGADDRLFWTSIDAIVSEPAQVLGSLCSFLGVPAGTLNFDRAREIIHQGDSGDIPPDLMQPLWERLADCYNLFEQFAPELVQQWRERPRGHTTLRSVAI